MLAPDILPVSTSFLKNAVILASFSGLNFAPGGMSKVPSAAAGGTVDSINSAPSTGTRSNFLEFINPSRLIPGSLAEGSVGARAAEGLQRLFVQQGTFLGKTAENDA